MTKLTIWERFKDAREVHNQHGKQTLEEVAKATGLAASLINSLEKENNERDVGYKKIISLAGHYGVSIDWLLGMSEAVSTDADIRSIADYLNLDDLFVIELENVLQNVSKEKIDAVFDVRLIDVIEHLYACFDVTMTSKVTAMLYDKHGCELEQIEKKVQSEMLKGHLRPEKEAELAEERESVMRTIDEEYNKIATSGILGPESSRMMHVQNELKRAWLDDFNSSGGFQAPMMTVSGMGLRPLIYANAENVFQGLIHDIENIAGRYAEQILSASEK